MEEYKHLVWPTTPLHFGDRFALKAGLLTSLGFGHVSGLIAVVHPQAFVESIPADQRERYLAAAAERHGRDSSVCSSRCSVAKPAYERPPNRRFGGDSVPAKASRQLEADMLLAEDARLGSDHVYRLGNPGCQ